jgi:hypothetical protein
MIQTVRRQFREGIQSKELNNSTGMKKRNAKIANNSIKVY